MSRPLGITLPIRLGSTGYFSNTTDALEQIRSNLTNLLLTRKGERPFQPEFGCDIPRIFFESNTDNNLAEIHALISTSVSKWMPFIKINDVNTKKITVDSQNVQVTLSYTVLTTNTSDSINLVF